MPTSFITRTNVRQSVPFFMVKSMELSLEFYVARLGFEVKMKWEPRGTIEWCWLQIGQAAIMLQEYRANIPEGKRGEGVSVCFMCDDSLAIYDHLLEQGLSCTTEPFVGNNLWVVSLTDPDGYQICFESPTDVQEETTYSLWIASLGQS